MNNQTYDGQIERIRQLAARVVIESEPISGIDFGFNRASVEWVEGDIERYRQGRTNSDAPTDLVGLYGAFLGECITVATNAQWQWDSKTGAWGILFPNGTWAFPFAKVSKQFANGVEGGDSIAGFYDIAVEYIATGKLSKP